MSVPYLFFENFTSILTQLPDKECAFLSTVSVDSSCLDGKFELDPVTNSCQNVYVQRMMGKQLFVAPSDIAGNTSS